MRNTYLLFIYKSYLNNQFILSLTPKSKTVFRICGTSASSSQDQLDRSCERRWSVRKSEWRKKYPNTIKRRKANWIGHISGSRKSFLKRDMVGNKEGMIEVTGGRGRRRKQLRDDLRERRGYWKLKDEALDRTLWRTRSGRGYKPVERQTTKWLYETTAPTFVARVK
jgi:hypothetical protein